MSICSSDWNRKFEWMAAEITLRADCEETIWVSRILAGDNIEGECIRDSAW